jgi:hypothetical protein
MAQLTLRSIVRIAAQYGLDPRSRLVMDNARQASKCHGTDGTIGHWHTDRFGKIDAELLLDGYLCEETRVQVADGLAHARFCEQAYGPADA